IHDIDPFTCLQFLQLGFGLFHLCMNLLWALLHVHQDAINQIGSLSFFFALVDRTRLSGNHPNYHTLLAMLLQILKGIIVMSAWKVKCGHPSLLAFAELNSTPSDLLSIADKILKSHTRPSYEKSKTKEKPLDPSIS
ncbi:hypothetical protein L210DRAFT_3414872, partial [Boletus edulis BED1]